MMKQDLQPSHHYVIGIDPDTERNGYAMVDTATRKVNIATAKLPVLLELVDIIQSTALATDKHLKVYVEAGWVNHPNWHLGFRDSKQMAAAKGKALGRNHQRGIDIVELLQYKDIVIWPLQSVREFFNEGLSMHHCVFKNGYYDKPDSLILTARNYVGGERIETIEFDLREGRVVQSRGRFNKLTERHEDILSLMRDNTSRIMKVAQLRCS